MNMEQYIRSYADGRLGEGGTNHGKRSSNVGGSVRGNGSAFFHAHERQCGRLIPTAMADNRAALAEGEPQRAYLNMENIVGAERVLSYKVFVDAPENEPEAQTNLRRCTANVRSGGGIADGMTRMGAVG